MGGFPAKIGGDWSVTAASQPHSIPPVTKPLGAWGRTPWYNTHTYVHTHRVITHTHTHPQAMSEAAAQHGFELQRLSAEHDKTQVSGGPVCAGNELRHLIICTPTRSCRVCCASCLCPTKLNYPPCFSPPTFHLRP